MAFCPKCGKAVADDAAFCPSCGTVLKPQQPQAAPPQTQAPSPAQPTSVSQSHTARNVVVIIAVVVVLALIVAGLGGTAPFAQGHNVNVVNGLITVPAGTHNYYQFTVPAGATSASLQGSFTASGGSGNDIVVLVMDSGNYTNWANGHSAYTYYNSGQVTTGSFNVNLPGSGQYYLVYNNEFSIFSSKNVQTTVNLAYHE